MKKIIKLFAFISFLLLIGYTLIPSAVVTAESINRINGTDTILYSDGNIILTLKEDSSVQKIVEEFNLVDGTHKSFILNKVNQSITISSDKGDAHYSKQELLAVGNSELGYGLRAANFAGAGSIGYNYNRGNYYLKITTGGTAREKNVRRNSRNAGYLDAFKHTVDDIKGKEWSIVGTLGVTAIGALVTGGIGAFSLLTTSSALIGIGNQIIKLTSRAQGYFWNV